jgi:hypothetical protein
MKDRINPKKLIITKENCKKVKDIILLSIFFELLKFLIENKVIKKEQPSPKNSE